MSKFEFKREHFNLGSIFKSITIGVDESFIASIFELIIEKADTVKLGKDMHELLEMDPGNVGRINNEDLKKFYQNIVLDAKKNGVSVQEAVKKIQKNVSDKKVRTIKSWEIENTKELNNACHILTVNPKVDSLMNEADLIRRALSISKIPYHIEIPSNELLGNGYMEPIKIITNTHYLKKTIKVINDIISVNEQDFNQVTILGARITKNIGYYSYNFEDNLTQKEKFGLLIEKSLIGGLVDLLEANPTKKIIIDNEVLEASDVNITKENIMQVAKSFINNKVSRELRDQLLGFFVKKTIENAKKDEFEIDIDHLFISADAINMIADYINSHEKELYVKESVEVEVPVYDENKSVNQEEIQEIVPIEERKDIDLDAIIKENAEPIVNAELPKTYTELVQENVDEIVRDNQDTIQSTNVEVYSKILTMETLTKDITLESGEVTNLINLFDKYQILNAIPLDSVCTLIDGTTMTGEQFIRTYGEQIGRFKNTEEFINTYASSIDKKIENEKKGIFSSIFRRK